AVLLPSGPFRASPTSPPIDRALSFLKRVQEPDGAWHPANHRGAVTALAVMAFLSAGHVPGEGPYRDVVDRGLRFVLRAQDDDGLITTDSTNEMYHHGICTLMLAEVAGMTDGALGREVRHKLQKATALILRAQRTAGFHCGGWRYRVQASDADLSVT